jgi:hypothetical protein
MPLWRAAGDADRRQADRPTADNAHPLARLQGGHPHAAIRDPGRLDEAGVINREPRRQRREAVLGHAHAVGQSPIGEDAEIDVARIGAAVVVAGAAGVAHAAARHRFDGVRRAVDESGELVTQRERQRSHRQETEVGPADAARRDLDQHAVTFGFRLLDDMDALLVVAHRSHQSPPELPSSQHNLCSGQRLWSENERERGDSSCV